MGLILRFGKLALQRFTLHDAADIGFSDEKVFAISWSSDQRNNVS
jgi:hypothetical protein